MGIIPGGSFCSYRSSEAGESAESLQSRALGKYDSVKKNSRNCCVRTNVSYQRCQHSSGPVTEVAQDHGPEEDHSNSQETTRKAFEMPESKEKCLSEDSGGDPRQRKEPVEKHRPCDKLLEKELKTAKSRP